MKYVNQMFEEELATQLSKVNSELTLLENPILDNVDLDVSYGLLQKCKKQIESRLVKLRNKKFLQVRVKQLEEELCLVKKELANINV